MSFRINLENAGIEEREFDAMRAQLEAACKTLDERNGQGNDFLGWLDLPESYDKAEYERVLKSAEYIRNNADALIVVGIGGSYLGAKAVSAALLGNFYNEQPAAKRKAPKIYFAGQNLSGAYLEELLELLDGQSVMVNVISKSGTTTEPAVAFRIIKAWMEKRYSKEELKKRIFATTDASRGALKQLADDEGYESFVIADDVGGRFSVLTAVGLLPLAVCGIDIDALLKGAAAARRSYLENGTNDVVCRYAVARNILHRRGKDIELLATYNPKLVYLSEWFKQLYGESEGKDGKGIFPASVCFTTDLHSMGQMIQDGKRNIFETHLVIKNDESNLCVEHDDKNLDALNYLEGKSVDYINSKAYEGTLMAHVDGGVNSIVLEMDALDAYTMGELLYFFERACAVSGYMLGVNPFNQPGVEAYKKNMFRLLGKQ